MKVRSQVLIQAVVAATLFTALAATQTTGSIEGAVTDRARPSPRLP